MFYIVYYFSEIKIRLIYIGIAWIAAFLMSYFYKSELIYLISRPFLQFHNKFIFLDLTEAFYITLNVCILASSLCLFPYCLYQLWSFFIPSRYIFERKIIKQIGFFFILLFFVQIFLIYTLIFPKICDFLMSFEIKTLDVLVSVELSARIQSYFNLFTRFFLYCLFFNS